MEQIAIWTAILLPIIATFVGWIFNSLITNKIDALSKRCDELETENENIKKSFYTALNGQRTSFEIMLKDYVRKDLYDQAIELHRINNDEKFKSLLSIVTTQYTNLEGKINDNNINMNNKVNDLKVLINEKFNNGHKSGNGM